MGNLQLLIDVTLAVLLIVRHIGCIIIRKRNKVFKKTILEKVAQWDNVSLSKLEWSRLKSYRCSQPAPGTQPHHAAPGDLRVELRKCVMISME